MKMIGIALIIFSCGMFGFMKAASLKREINSLHDLVGILNLMECELNFKLTPLPQLCRSCAGNGKSLEKLFVVLADELENQIAPDVSTCMAAAIEKCRCPYASLQSLLTELGYSFGKFDLQGQVSGIETVSQRCSMLLDKLEKNKDVRIRNYQTLSLCAGTVLALILL